MKSKTPERSSKRKARRDSVSSSLGEPEAASQRTENVPSISDRDFSEISEKIEKSVGRRIKDAETGQREILKMIENLSSKIDSLSGHPPRSENPKVDLYEPENQASTSRPTTLDELHPSQGQHMVTGVFPQTEAPHHRAYRLPTKIPGSHSGQAARITQECHPTKHRAPQIAQGIVNNHAHIQRKERHV